MFKKGDKVVMHTCGEADHYKGKIWTCRSDEFTSSAKQQVVFLEGFSGYFLVNYLQFVDLGQLLAKEETLREIKKELERVDILGLRGKEEDSSTWEYVGKWHGIRFVLDRLNIKI